jgi:DNA polymerase-3 subunit beta
MRVICTHENLKKSLGLVTRVSSGNLTLPILNNILIKTDNSLLKLSSTNLEVAVNTWVRCKIEKEGGITVPAKTFSELINNLPSGNISLYTENLELFIESGSFKTKIRGLNSEEFPLIPQFDQQSAGNIPIDALRLALSQTSFATAYSETQPEMSGIFLSFGGGELKVVATDRYRLAEKKMAIEGSFENKNVIIPNRSVQELNKVLSLAEGEDIQIFFSQGQIMFKTQDTELISRLIDAQYPDYEQIIPLEFKTEIECNTSDVVAAMRTAGIFTQAGNNVNLTFKEPDNFSVTSSSSDIGESDVDILSKVTGEAGSIIFNHRYVLDCLSVIGTSKVKIKIINNNAPGVICSPEMPGYTYLVMPIRI